MKSLRKIILTNLRNTTVIMVVLILLLALLIQVLLVQNQTRANAQATFLQVGQVLEANERELATVEEEYRQTCLLSAEAIAYIIQRTPDILGDVQEFRQLAYMMEVDEIHIFDNTGRIFTGTHPEYFDFTFDTGEQIGFFRPLLEDKDLKLCQDITPNTAEGKLVQYSALWSQDENFIVQVGMYPEAVLEATEKNELSYIFSLLQGNPGVDLYAVDGETGMIVGSTSGTANGKSMEHIGLRLQDMKRYFRGALVTVAGVDSYCVFTDMDGILLGYVIPQDLMYKNVILYTLGLAVGLVLIAAIFSISVWQYTNRYIVRSIERTNQQLRAVSNGDLEARAEEKSSQEFSELSSHINDMIKSLLASTDKMSFVLNRTQIPIGVYEFNPSNGAVRFTEYIPKLLELEPPVLKKIAQDHTVLEALIAKLRQSPLAGEEGVFQFTGTRNRYLKLEQITQGSDTLGIVMDVTQEIQTRRQIEADRDRDLLTGLYNRRGLTVRLSQIFDGNQDPGYGAMVLLDSDGLKSVNDTHGHAVGDTYLRELSQRIRNFGTASHISARLGGDEFVLLLYGYSDEASVFEELERLRSIQKSTYIQLEDGRQLPVKFSFGYTMIHGRRDYETLMSEADRYMYAVKRKRKEAE